MNHDEVKTRLHDYLDGELSSEERALLESHLATCIECRRELESSRQLLREAAELPQVIEPGRDLWPEIAARLTRPGLGDRTLRSLRIPLAAAAVLLVAITWGITAILLDRSSDLDTVEVSPSGDADWLVVESPLVRAVEELTLTFAENRERLAPETVARIETNLRVIDAAIGETRAALFADPADANLRQMLWNAYRAKLDLLQGVSRWLASS